jgi:hypothetical protein
VKSHWMLLLSFAKRLKVWDSKLHTMIQARAVSVVGDGLKGLGDRFQTEVSI